MQATNKENTPNWRSQHDTYSDIFRFLEQNKPDINSIVFEYRTKTLMH